MSMQKPRFLCNRSSSFPSHIFSGARLFTTGEVHPKRIFPSFVGLFIYDGILHMQEGKKKYDIKAGQWLILSPQNLHFGYKSGKVNVSYYWVHFMPFDDWWIERDNGMIFPKIKDEKTGGGVYKSLFSMILPMSGKCTQSMYTTIEQLIDSYNNKSIFETEAAFLRLLELMIDKPPETSPYEIPIQQIIGFMAEHFTQSNFSLTEVASNCGFTRQYITRLLKNHTGKTFSENLHELRVEYAKNHLSVGKKTVSEISSDLGYDDVSIFSRMFKKQVGISPKSYSKQEKEKFLKVNDDTIDK